MFIGCSLLLLVKKYLKSEYEYIFYTDEVLKVDEVNDDSLGASFYAIKDLSKDKLSKIAILELEKLGYKIS